MLLPLSGARKTIFAKFHISISPETHLGQVMLICLLNNAGKNFLRVLLNDPVTQTKLSPFHPQLFCQFFIEICIRYPPKNRCNRPPEFSVIRYARALGPVTVILHIQQKLFVNTLQC